MRCAPVSEELRHAKSKGKQEPKKSCCDSMASSYHARTFASVKATDDSAMDDQMWAATLAEARSSLTDRTMSLHCHLDTQRLLVLAYARNLSGLLEKKTDDTTDEIAAMVKRCRDCWSASA